jgi:hypothetical protein
MDPRCKAELYGLPSHSYPRSRDKRWSGRALRAARTVEDLTAMSAVAETS